MPATIARDPVARSDLDFLYFLALRPVLRSEDKVAGLPDCFLGRPSEDSFCARTPVGDAIVQVDDEHRVLGSTFDEQSVTFLSNKQLLSLSFSAVISRATPATRVSVPFSS